MNDATDTSGIVGRQVESMLKLLRRYESAEIEKILDRAYLVADQRVRAARHEARTRMHEAIQELRAEAEAKLTRVRAGTQAEDRQRELEKARLVLEEGRGLLRDSVAARWQDADSRRAWTLALLERAEEVLPPGQWAVAHAPSWPEDERRSFCERVAELAGEAPRLTSDDDIVAGLRIGLEGAFLDGTLKGLLGRGSEIEARLLAEYDAVLAASRAQGGTAAESSSGGSL